MTNRPRKQGTAFETALCSTLNAVPGVDARRLAEGGSQDRGDLEIVTAQLAPIVVECKAREKLSVHDTVAKASQKAQNGRRAAVVWKRLLKSRPDARRRTEAGDGPIVAMPLPLFCELLEQAGKDSL